MVSFRKHNNGKLPTVKECIAYIESCGHWEYQGRCITHIYVFRNEYSGIKEVSFSMHELREAFIYGW